jgi:hypothetical protein
VANGLFSVVIGDSTVANMQAISSGVFTPAGLQLQIWFNDGVHGWAALSPLQNLTAAPYSTAASFANSLNGMLPASQVSGTLGNAALPSSPAFSGTVTAANFTGNGAGLTNLASLNLTGPMSIQSGPTNQLNFSGAVAINGTTIINPAGQWVGNPTGLIGPQGPVGPVGVNGKTVWNGSGSPSSNIGTNGDFYIDTSGHYIYGPKSSGSWGSGVSLVGPQGTPGVTGATGGTGPQGPIGATGPQGATGRQGPQGAAGKNGVNGTNGLDGTNGITGAQGPPGINGTNGIDGAQGPQGPQGTNGVAGEQGGQGLEGDFGPDGPQGDQGPQGPQGARGPEGPEGPEGEPDYCDCDDIRALKLSQTRQNIGLVDGRDILNRLTALPIKQWIPEGEGTNNTHVGPTPSDFVAAFDLGSNTPRMNLVDGEGITLAAIQAMNQMLDEKDAEIQDLKARLQKLEQLMNGKTGQTK